MESASLIDAVRVEGAVVACGEEGGDLLVRPAAELRNGCVGARAFAACADEGDVGLGLSLAGAVGGLVVPFNPAEQRVAELLPRAGKAGLALIGCATLAGGAFAGGRAPHPVPAVVEALRPLVTPHRSLVQTAVLFSLANMHLHSVLVRVSSEEHLDEVIGAAEAEPLTVPDLERIFEIYAHRYDENPAKGCR